MKSSVLLALLLSSLTLASKGKENGRTCRIVCVDRPGDAPQEIQLFDGSTSHKVRLSDMNFSDVITLPAGDLALSLTQDPVATAEEVPAGSPTVKISAEVTDFYLIAVGDPENDTLPIRLLPVTSGVEYPKPGETLWINLSKHRIKAELGETSFTIAPGERLLGDAPLPASGYYKAVFEYQPDGGDNFLPIMKKSWWFDATSRNLGFVIDTEARLPVIFSFRDQRTPASPAGKN